MSLSTLLESKNRELRDSLFTWQEKAKQYQTIIAAKDKRISDLEAWNEMLAETGHWIGQEEAYDLKMAVQEFLEAIWDSQYGHWTSWDVREDNVEKLALALKKCGSFKSYSTLK